jgi:hypothetical protein
MAYLAINAVTREARARAATVQHQPLNDHYYQSPKMHLQDPANDHLSSMGRGMVGGKRPAVPFLPSPPPTHPFEPSLRPPAVDLQRCITQGQPLRSVLVPTLASATMSFPASSMLSSEDASTLLRRRPAARSSATSSPAIPVPIESPLCLSLDRDGLESELSSYYESRTEAMLDKLRHSATSSDAAHSWGSSFGGGNDDGRRSPCHCADLGALDESAANGCDDEDDGEDIFALEFADESESKWLN